MQKFRSRRHRLSRGKNRPRLVPRRPPPRSNGGGRSEVQAGHIRPVASDGPDSVRNGLAMSSTIHWMFDRGLVSVDEDHRILLARGRVPDGIERLINSDHRLAVPGRLDLRPHRKLLEFHRREVFKG